MKKYPNLELVLYLVATTLVVRFLPGIEPFFVHGPESVYLSLSIVFLSGYLLNFKASKTYFPSFGWAILFGIALQPVLLGLVTNLPVLVVVIELLAALVLFGGGVEVPYDSFKKYIGPIASLAILATLGTIYLFGLTLDAIGSVAGISIAGINFLVLAAILSSIDPTAIIPSLKNVRLKRPFLKDLAVSESAVNDVVGTIITRVLLLAALGAAAGASVTGGFMILADRSVLDALALEFIWGLIVGVCGAWMLKKWLSALETSTGKRNVHDPALFFAVPIFCFAAGSIVGGSGFLAAFVAGLLFDASKPTKPVQEFFEAFGDGFIKPIVFVLLGALAPVALMIEYWWVGIIAAFIFMFIIRPLVVFVTLTPWAKDSDDVFTWQELSFISFVRETGAIPAVLLLTLATTALDGASELVAIGMWVILLTLMIEPPLTPWVARKLDLVKK